MNWQRSLKLKAKIKKNEPLKKHTTFKIGGKARFFVEPRGLPDLKALVLSFRENKTPLFIIGAGSNILACDKGLNAIVVKLSQRAFRKISIKASRMEAGSGVSLAKLIQAARARNMGGLEFLSGIPGTLGGALVMNAGAWGKSISDLVENVKVMDYNNIINILGRDKIKFAYRSSGLEKYIILGASLRLKKSPKEAIDASARSYLARRGSCQDYSLPNAGCIFKNPAGKSAGRLIDLCGLKGRAVGGARVSERHANFIVNRKQAKSADVVKLISLIQRKVKERFRITLEPEIKVWK